MTNTSTRTSLAIPKIVFAAFLRRTFPDLPEDVSIKSVVLGYEQGRPIVVEIEYDHREKPLRIASPVLTAIGDGASDAETED